MGDIKVACEVEITHMDDVRSNIPSPKLVIHSSSNFRGAITIVIGKESGGKLKTITVSGSELEKAIKNCTNV